MSSSTASSGATLASILSRALTIASIDRTVDSGEPEPAIFSIVARHLGVDQFHARARLHGKHVAIERHQVEKVAIELVARGSLCPLLLNVTELLELWSRPLRGPLGFSTPSPASQLDALRRVDVLGALVSSLGSAVNQLTRRNASTPPESY